MDDSVSAGGMRAAASKLADLHPSSSSIDAEVDGLPDAVRRYFLASIDPGTRLAPSARLRMRGSIKVGPVWLPFRADQILAPLHGFVWAARVAGLLKGSDRYADGEGAMEWKLVGVIPVVHAEGPDVSHGAAGRAGAEAMWVPTAMLPCYGVRWGATDAHHISASYRVDDTELELRYTLRDDALVTSIALDRWAGADGSGPARERRFVHEATGHRRIDGVTIPTSGRAAWLDEADRWSDGEFFRYEIVDMRLVA